MNQITPVLSQIGLTESEQKVYVALLDLGDSTRSDIVNTSGVAGSKIYELLEKLQEKGLVSIYMKDNVKHFKAVNPNQILNYVQKKKSELLDIEIQAHNILPILLGKFNASKEDQEIELLSGIRGLEIIFREQVELLHGGDTCYVLGGTKGSDEAVVQAFFEKIHLMREQKKIKTKMLFNSNQKQSTEELYSTKKYPCTSTKYIDHDSPVAINIYANRTVILIFGRQISAIHIKSQDVANSFMEYFNLLWKVSKK